MTARPAQLQVTFHGERIGEKRGVKPLTVDVCPVCPVATIEFELTRVIRKYAREHLQPGQSCTVAVVIDPGTWLGNGRIENGLRGSFTINPIPKTGGAS